MLYNIKFQRFYKVIKIHGGNWKRQAYFGDNNNNKNNNKNAWNEKIQEKGYY